MADSEARLSEIVHRDRQRHENWLKLIRMTEGQWQKYLVTNTIEPLPGIIFPILVNVVVSRLFLDYVERRMKEDIERVWRTLE